MNSEITHLVALALAEDLGTTVDTLDAQLDLTAQLIPAERHATAQIITREAGVFCGQALLEATFAALSDAVKITWHVQDGDEITPIKEVTLAGPAQILLTGERVALNFTQTLSGTDLYTDLRRKSHIPLPSLDTAKPCQITQSTKYAVRWGGAITVSVYMMLTRLKKTILLHAAVFTQLLKLHVKNTG